MTADRHPDTGRGSPRKRETSRSEDLIEHQKDGLVGQAFAQIVKQGECICFHYMYHGFNLNHLNKIPPLKTLINTPLQSHINPTTTSIIDPTTHGNSFPSKFVIIGQTLS